VIIIEGLKDLFSQGKAKPTDLVLDEDRFREMHPESLFEVNSLYSGNMYRPLI